MKSITAKELKNRTGDVLRRVEKGEKVVITKRGKPCAIISPLKDEEFLRMQVGPYKNAWKDIEKTLRSTKPRHKRWEEGIRQSRRT
jgi:prevent-host-death family protein